MPCHEVRLHRHHRKSAPASWVVEYEGGVRRASTLIEATTIACRIAVLNRGWQGESTSISVRNADGAWSTLLVLPSGERAFSG
ncbi:MAG TPA: hypothetical protein VND91_02425 [Candidatus Saccharimonadia bacterium]|nr:hypothetical protein [Candidatus Saccharimonadia bacterium]